MTFQIEQLGLEELCAFLRLQAEDSFPDLKNEERLNLLAEKWSRNAECCTCRNKGKLEGMIAFYANGRGADFAYIPHVYVSSSYRQQGVFGHMLNTTISYVKKRGFRMIRLEVQGSNTKAQIVYMKYGFKEKEKTPFSIYMEKTLF